MNQQVPPILLLIFNRPEKTFKVIESLRKVKPAILYVSADGPRPNNPADAIKCKQARMIATQIDWPCDIKTKFSDINLGCDPAVISGINWFFQHVKNGIILEDDCIPHPHFFRFCHELLDYYNNDKRIMRIAGLAPHPPREYPYDYHFSRRFYCSGWATWKRAWRLFNHDIDKLGECELKKIITSFYEHSFQARPILINMKKLFTEKRRNWDFIWDMSCYAQNGLSIVPERNLIMNIGFDKEGTHTKKFDSIFANLKTNSLKFPLRHPENVYYDKEPEMALYRLICKRLSIKSKISQQMKHIFATLNDYWLTMPCK